jgi:fibronectin type 3 domain-containing protein
LTWKAPDNGGSAITDYVLYKGTSSGGEKKLADLGTHTSFQDSKIKPGTTYYYYLVAKNGVGSSQPSPEVTPQLVNGKPMCTAPGQLVVTDSSGDQIVAPSSPSLDITGIYIQEPANTNDLAITLSVADLSSMGPLQQWRVFWDNADGSGNRWYVGMDTDATGAPSFIYGTNFGLDSPVKYAPGTQQTTNTALPGSGYNPAAGTITVVVPKDQVGSPAPGDTLGNVQARTFVLSGGVTTTSNTAIDSSPYSNYQVMGNSYCS